MQWSDEGVIIAVRRHGETSAIIEAMTRRHGRHAGLVRAGRSRANRALLQPGNRVDLAWRARLDEHLGTYTVEPVSLNAGRLMEDAAALAGLSCLCAHAALLPEREAHERLYGAALVLLDVLDDFAVWPATLVRFELGLLEELGFGLDLTTCALGGASDDLGFVSPRSGRAVSRQAGQAWRDKLLPLPAFLISDQAGSPGVDDVVAGLRLTGHFLDRDLYRARGIEPPRQRQWLISRLADRARAP